MKIVDKIKTFLGFEITPKIDELKKIYQEMEMNSEIRKSLASEYMKQTSFYDNRASQNDEVVKSIEERYHRFLTTYSDDLKKASGDFKNLNKRYKELLVDPEIKKADGLHKLGKAVKAIKDSKLESTQKDLLISNLLKKSVDLDILKSTAALLNQEIIAEAETSDDRVVRIMKSFKEGILKDSNGNLVTDKKTALAISLQEAGIEKSNISRVLEVYNLKNDISMYSLKIEKAIQFVRMSKSGLLTADQFEKALKNLSHLVPKKVTIKSKDGSVHQAIRWVNPDTGEAEKHTDKAKVVSVDADFEKRIEALVHTGEPVSVKLRGLINEGIYDRGLLGLLSGNPGEVPFYLNEAGIDKAKRQTETPADVKLKDVIRKEQAVRDTPEGIASSKVLPNQRSEQEIDEVFEDYENDVHDVIDGDHKFALAYGTGGVGKTFTVTQLLRKKGLKKFNEEEAAGSRDATDEDFEGEPVKDEYQYDYMVVSGKISPSRVYAEMYKHRDKLLIFDDCDTFLIMPEVQGFLKAGLGTGIEDEISNMTGAAIYVNPGEKSSGRIPNVFRFTGRVIAITNLRAQDLDQAVRSRALISNLSLTPDETMSRLSKIKDSIKILSADKTRELDIDPQAKTMAFDLIKEFKDKLGRDINTRTYSNTVLKIDKSIKRGYDDERVRRTAIGYLESVMGTFDEKMKEVYKSVKK